MSGDPYLALGEFLTSTEALRISKALESEGLLSQALKRSTQSAGARLGRYLLRQNSGREMLPRQ